MLSSLQSNVKENYNIVQNIYRKFRINCEYYNTLTLIISQILSPNRKSHGSECKNYGRIVPAIHLLRANHQGDHQLMLRSFGFFHEQSAVQSGSPAE